MATGDPRDRTLPEHRAIAKPYTDPAVKGVRNGWIPPDHPAVAALAGLDPDIQRSVVIDLLARVSGTTGLRSIFGGSRAWTAEAVLRTMASRRPPFSRGDVTLLLTLAGEIVTAKDPGIALGVCGQAVAAAERSVRAEGLHELDAPIRRLADALRDPLYQKGDAARYRARLLALVQASAAETGAPAPPLDPRLFGQGDTFGVLWRARAKELTPDQRRLIVHCSLAGGVAPSAKWRKEALPLTAADGTAELLRSLLTDALNSRTTEKPQIWDFEGRRFETAGPALADANVLLVRGAIWAAAGIDEPWVAPLLGEVGLYYGTSGGSSNVARDERLGNTAAAALGARADRESIAALGRMKARVTNRNVSKQILKALDGAAATSGMSASELLELAIPTEGLDADGTREIEIGDHAAVLSLDGDDASLVWHAPDGRETARPPVALADRPAEVAHAKTALKDLRKAYGLERGRVEELFTEDREWSVEDWRARYLEHPLTGAIGRRLIWRVLRDGEDVATGVPDGAGLRSADGEPFDLRPDDRLRLWHPIDATDAAISAWRTTLLDRRLRQPFKQAFREVYSLTPAEQETLTYSNRFAAHILRYPQARALMTVRRWGSNFLGAFDGGYTGVARRDFRSHAIRAEFWHDAIDEELQAGEAVHCTTDQVRFIRLGRVEEVMELADVPPIVFSEAMRDVDLFVSVTTIGADRNWQDGGQGRVNRFENYWAGTWEEPLSATAAVRRDVLDRMLPGLAIADRLELQDRWLQVRGDLRTYRIHLGSGNILMAPADRYLCIVPARGGRSEQVFLPFDDDPTLSTILSKAFLLAADAKITDRSIVAQIRSS